MLPLPSFDADEGFFLEPLPLDLSEPFVTILAPEGVSLLPPGLLFATGCASVHPATKHGLPFFANLHTVGCK